MSLTSQSPEFQPNSNCVNPISLSFALNKWGDNPISMSFTLSEWGDNPIAPRPANMGGGTQ